MCPWAKLLPRKQEVCICQEFECPSYCPSLRFNCHYLIKVLSANLILQSRPYTTCKYFLTRNEVLILKFLFIYCISILAKNVKCPNKFYLSVFPKNDNGRDSNLDSYKAKICDILMTYYTLSTYSSSCIWLFTVCHVRPLKEVTVHYYSVNPLMNGVIIMWI